MDSMTRWQQALEHNPADLSRNKLWSVCVSVAMSFQIKDGTYQEFASWYQWEWAATEKLGSRTTPWNPRRQPRTAGLRTHGQPQVDRDGGPHLAAASLAVPPETVRTGRLSGEDEASRAAGGSGRRRFRPDGDPFDDEDFVELDNICCPWICRPARASR